MEYGTPCIAKQCVKINRVLLNIDIFLGATSKMCKKMMMGSLCCLINFLFFTTFPKLENIKKLRGYFDIYFNRFPLKLNFFFNFFENPYFKKNFFQCTLNSKLLVLVSQFVRKTRVIVAHNTRNLNGC